MTDRTHSRAFAEPGHRYMPRHSGQKITVTTGGARVTVNSVQEAPAPRPATSALNRPARVNSTVKPARSRQHRSLVLRRKGLKAPVSVVSAAPVSVSEPSVNEASLPKRRRSRLHPANIHPVLVFSGAAIVAAVLVFGGGLLLFKPKGETQDKYSLGSGPSTLGVSTNEPNNVNVNEVAPTNNELAAYRVDPDEPRYLKIPKLQLTARVLAMDAGKGGLPAIPQNIFDAGWFTTSAKPGTSGVMLVNGQVAGSSKAGLFNSLESLTVGDLIQVERGDGKTLTYKVAKLEQHDPANITAATAMQPADGKKPGLNLLAANSRYNVKKNTFEKRVLVRAVQQ